MTGRQRVVVLGGLGFIGQHLSRALVAQRHEVVIFDRAFAASPPSGVRCVTGDVANATEVVEVLRQADAVFHLAHTSVPGSSMLDPAYDVSANVASSAAWLARLDQTSVRTIVYVSSGGTVYGTPCHIPITEKHPTDPLSSYGVTKLAIEKYVALFCARFGITWRLVRPSNVYGEGQRLDRAQGLIGIAADRLLHGHCVEVWGNGQSRRDYLHVDDAVNALLAVAAYDGPETVFNVSQGAAHSVLEVIRLVAAALDVEPMFVFKPDRGFDIPVNVLDSTRLRRETGWTPTVSLEEGIRRTADWLKARP